MHRWDFSPAAKLKQPTREETWKVNPRLQPDVVPENYDVCLRPDLVLGRFFGTETITVNVEKPKFYIAVHAKNLHMSKSSVSTENGDEVLLKAAFAYQPHDFWIMEFEDLIYPGVYKLYFEFDGSMKKKGAGIFRLESFAGKACGERYIAVSNFQPAYARQAFPCFDDPKWPSNFKLKVIRPADNYICLSNEKVEKEEFGPEKNQVTVFFRSLRRPTFLLGLFVIDFRMTTMEEMENMGKTFAVRLFGQIDTLTRMAFAKDMICQLMRFYINYFDVPYPLETLDVLSIPKLPEESTYYSGIISFKESLFLYDEDHNSYQDRTRTSIVLAKSLAQQWFGCLVYMKSLNEAWLMEGISTFMRYKSLDEGAKICRDWTMQWEELLYEAIQAHLEEDSASYSKPLAETKMEEEDSKAQNKAMSILKMLEGLLGRETFRRGLHRFLQKYSWSSAVASDLWQCLQEESADPELDISGIMESWSKQGGYPVVYAIRRANIWILSQSKFTSDRLEYNEAHSPYRCKWDIPVHYITSNSSKPELVWLKKADECVKITVTDRTVTFVKFNANQTGAFRVNYEGCLWRNFAQILKQDHLRIDLIDRANLLDDVFCLAEAGHTEFQYAFDLMLYMEKESDYLPWAVISRITKKMIGQLMTTPAFGNFLKFGHHIISRMYGSAEAQYSWNSTTNNTKRLLRAIILDLASIFKLPECMHDLRMKFKEWIRTEEFMVPLDVSDILLRNGMREFGTLEDWEKVWNMYKREIHSDNKNRLLECLANTKDRWIVYKVLSDQKEEMTDDDYFTFFNYMTENPYVRDFAWQYIQNEWPKMMERFPNDPRLQKYVCKLVQYLNLKSSVVEVKNFMERYPNAPKGLELSQKVVESNAQWLIKQRDHICNWLDSFVNQKK